MFRVPSSTPPPSSRRQSQNAPSTTPAGPPPSSTPAGPPPAMNSLFGSSRPNFGQPYNFNNSFNITSSPPKHGLFEGIGSGSIGTSTTGRPGTQRGRTVSSNSYQAHDTFSDDGLDRDADGDSYEEDMDDEMDEEEDEGDYEDEDMDENGDNNSVMEESQSSTQRRAKTQNRFSQSVASRTSMSELEPGPTLVRSGAKQTQFNFLDLAKGLAPTKESATLHEPDNMLLESERLLEKIQASFQSDSPDTRSQLLGDTAQDLVALWQTSTRGSKTDPSNRSTGSAGLTHATQLASLLLSIHHPPPLAHTQRSSSLSLVPARHESRSYTAVPKVLLDWLNKTYPGVSEVDVVLKETRGYSRHPSYWEAVHVTTVRGSFGQTIKLLQGAQFEHAETAQHDGAAGSGYSGQHLRAANEVTRAAIDLLHECPAVASGDWDIKGHDWSIFRQRVNQAYTNLQEYAEGESASRHSVSQPFQASHFGISQAQSSFQLSVVSRKAESRVPWSVYENLGKLYQLLLGNEEEILTLSADWIEAALGLTIWWNGEEEDVAQGAQGSLAASRRSLMRSQRIRSVDVTPVKAYMQRLSAALAAVIENSDDDFGVNVTDRFEVGLACIMDENVDAVLQILSSWSLTIASAVAELASAGGWVARTGGLMDQFNDSDLLVMSYNGGQPQAPKGVTKDSLNIAYSEQLAARGPLKDKDGQVSKEGWEVAIQVLGRLNDSVEADHRIEEILHGLPLESASRVDRITQLCHNLGLEQHALAIAQKYADHLRTNTQSYGDTLLYYARAHDAARIQEVLRVLVAHCLVKSVAYPPLDELDESLHSLITTPKQTLTKLARLDSEAAALLSNHLSGYATIRRFYDLRDEEVLLKNNEKPKHRPMARKRAAANSLMVIIASATSSIRGGLYDPEVETVVQVDVLLPLLGEALVFVNQPKRTLTISNLYSLLAAVEDIDTSPSMIRTQCEEVLSTTLLSAHDPNSSQNLPHPRSLLQKSTSNLTTASSQFSFIGSTELGSVDTQSTESSAVLVKGGHVDDAKRGWDWRRGFHKGTKGADLIRVLRLGITKEVGRAFAEGEFGA